MADKKNNSDIEMITSNKSSVTTQVPPHDATQNATQVPTQDVRQVKNSTINSTINYTKNVINNVKNKVLTYAGSNKIMVVCGFIFVLISILLLRFIIPLTYNVEKYQCTKLDNFYSTNKSNIQPIMSSNTETNPATFKLCDYYIKTAYNACSIGSYKGDYVDTCILKDIINQGVRCLDFQIFSIDNTPVVATTTLEDNYQLKETKNSVLFADVMSIIYNFGLSTSLPNYTDPMIIHLRFNTNSATLYDNMADILIKYTTNLLGIEYSYTNYKTNLCASPLTELANKIIIMVDGTNTAFQGTKFEEYVNLTSSTQFMRFYRNIDVNNVLQPDELQGFNKKNLTMAVPDLLNPTNVNYLATNQLGIQMTGMMYQRHKDINLTLYNDFFNKNGFAFVLKPPELRETNDIAQKPIEQTEQVSYATRTIQSNYYAFNI